MAEKGQDNMFPMSQFNLDGIPTSHEPHGECPHLAMTVSTRTVKYGKNPHLANIEISECSKFDRRMKRCSIETKRKLHCIYLKIFSWWPGIGSWNASWWIPIISTMGEESLVQYHDWLLFWIGQHFDNLFNMAFQMTWTEQIMSKGLVKQP